MSNPYKVYEPAPGHARYEPALVVAELTIHVPPPPPVPRVLVRRFRPIYTDRWVCAYGTNGSPRDRMRHDARVLDERCQTHPYTRIAEMR